MTTTDMKMYAIICTMIVATYFLMGQFNHRGDPLPSWHDGMNKNRILKFVSEATDKNHANFIPEHERIATFDQDGTLWVEYPLYTELMFAIDKIKETAAEHPEWQNIELFQNLLSNNREWLKNITMKDIEKIIEVTHTGLSIEQFHEEVNSWLELSKQPRFNRRYTELIYQPMLELIQLLKHNGFKTYISSGGGQEFIRAYSDKIYQIPVDQVIGTAGKVAYEFNNHDPQLKKEGALLWVNDKAGKPEGINLIIGKKPAAAFGNSTGDREMLQWSQSNPKQTLQLLVHHDDDVREYAYGADSKIGTFSKDLMSEAENSNWIVVSMKNDWKIIFPWETNSSAVSSNAIKTEIQQELISR